ncbi:MAG: cytochrome c-type biogenesis protein CcmH [Acidobacteriaceae bacterium]|nr:cytochrome c-type biogenesis protein CcmH [Acidobacteriaceae bacterium]
MLRSLGSALVILVLLGAPGLWAQSAAEIESDSVKRVGARLACFCGCKSTVACEMPGGCQSCKRMKTQIAKLQMDGKSDQAIIDQMVKENGPQIYLAEPGTFGWLIPYLAAALGLFVIYWFVRRNLRTPAPADGPPLDSEVLHRYHDRIEKDLEKLE